MARALPCHALFLNAYLVSKGQKPVDLEPFRTLPSSQATGSNKTAKRLTNLMNLTVGGVHVQRPRGGCNRLQIVRIFPFLRPRDIVGDPFLEELRLLAALT